MLRVDCIVHVYMYISIQIDVIKVIFAHVEGKIYIFTIILPP